MFEPGSRNSQAVEVECYAGGRAAQYPRRVRINEVWFDIFEITRREVVEDFASRQRWEVFHCHIGDNIQIRLVKTERGWSRT